jgi:hypothetical protein
VRRSDREMLNRYGVVGGFAVAPSSNELSLPLSIAARSQPGAIVAPCLGTIAVGNG